MKEGASRLPLTRAALQEIALPGADKVHMPGTFEEFLYLLDAAEFPVEYQPKELILMSYASPSMACRNIMSICLDGKPH